VSKIRPSRNGSSFTESAIRELTRLSVAHGAINLSQGFPDFISVSDGPEGRARRREQSSKRRTPWCTRVRVARVPASALKP
jgi:hypothetical protein